MENEPPAKSTPQKTALDKTEEEAFDAREFFKRHLKVSAWANERSQVYTFKELNELIEQVIDLFKKETALATLSPPCVIVGDIHGQYRDLLRILGFSNSREKHGRLGFSLSRFMFLGDYVDRGPHSVECICLVFTLKILYPDQYMLLRGNHETRAINFAYGFREELINKMGQKEGVDIWEKFNEAFSWMPLAGLVGTKILCMHGGISPYLTSLDSIREIERPLPEVNENKLALDLLWSDPLDYGNIKSVLEDPQYLKNGLRGLSVTFNEAAVIDTCTRLKIDLIVRAHQVMDNGFRFFCNKKLVTIFSAPRYMNESNNKGALLMVQKNGRIGITTMKAKVQPTPKSTRGGGGGTPLAASPIDLTNKSGRKTARENSTQSTTIKSQRDSLRNKKNK